MIGEYEGELPDTRVLESLLRDIRRFGDRPIVRTLTHSEAREIQKAVGLINALVFEEAED